MKGSFIYFNYFNKDKEFICTNNAPQKLSIRSDRLSVFLFPRHPFHYWKRPWETPTRRLKRLYSLSGPHAIEKPSSRWSLSSPAWSTRSKSRIWITHNALTSELTRITIDSCDGCSVEFFPLISRFFVNRARPLPEAIGRPDIELDALVIVQM